MGVRSAGPYLLPVLGPGETMELSKVTGLWRSHTWFRRLNNKRPLIMLWAPYNNEWEPDIGDREHFLAAIPLVTVTTDGREFRVFGPDKQRSWHVFIDSGSSEVYFSVFAPAGLTANELVAELQDIAVPFPEGSDNVPGFILSQPPITEGLIYIKSPNHESVLTAGFQTPSSESIRVQDHYPGFSTVAVDGRNVEFAVLPRTLNEPFAAAWTEEDGFEVIVYSAAVTPLDFPALSRRFRRVSKAEWDEAYASHAVAYDLVTPPNPEPTVSDTNSAAAGT